MTFFEFLCHSKYVLRKEYLESTLGAYYSIHNILPYTVLPGAEEVKIEFHRLHRR